MNVRTRKINNDSSSEYISSLQLPVAQELPVLFSVHFLRLTGSYLVLEGKKRVFGMDGFVDLEMCLLLVMAKVLKGEKLFRFPS